MCVSRDKVDTSLPAVCLVSCPAGSRARGLVARLHARHRACSHGRRVRGSGVARVVGGLYGALQVFPSRVVGILASKLYGERQFYGRT